MAIKINAENQKTKDFLAYIVKNIAKKQSLKQYDEVLVEIQKGKTPFPEFKKYDHGLGSDYDALEMQWKSNPKYNEKAILIAKYLNENFENSAITSTPKQDKNKPLTFIITIVISNPFEILKIYQKLNTKNELKKIILKNEKQSNKDISKIELYLNQIGDLWREPKIKYCYHMEEKNDRHKIFRYLVENKGYQNTNDIACFLGDKKEQVIRTEIKKIKDKASYFLSIKNSDLIESRKGSGYKINPKYHIKITIL